MARQKLWSPPNIIMEAPWSWGFLQRRILLAGIPRLGRVHSSHPLVKPASFNAHPPRALSFEYRSAAVSSKPGSGPRCPVLLAERGEPFEAGEWEPDGLRARTCRLASFSHGIDLHAGTGCVFRRFRECVMKHVAAAERAGLWLDPPFPRPARAFFLVS